MQMYLFLAGKSFITAQRFIIQNKELGEQAALHQVLANVNILVKKK